MRATVIGLNATGLRCWPQSVFIGDPSLGPAQIVGTAGARSLGQHGSLWLVDVTIAGQLFNLTQHGVTVGFVANELVHFGRSLGGLLGDSDLGVAALGLNNRVRGLGGLCRVLGCRCGLTIPGMGAADSCTAARVPGRGVRLNPNHLVAGLPRSALPRFEPDVGVSRREGHVPGPGTALIVLERATPGRCRGDATFAVDLVGALAHQGSAVVVTEVVQAPAVGDVARLWGQGTNGLGGLLRWGCCLSCLGWNCWCCRLCGSLGGLLGWQLDGETGVWVTPEDLAAKRVATDDLAAVKVHAVEGVEGAVLLLDDVTLDNTTQGLGASARALSGRCDGLGCLGDGTLAWGTPAGHLGQLPHQWQAAHRHGLANRAQAHFLVGQATGHDAQAGVLHVGQGIHRASGVGLFQPATDRCV